MGRGTAARPALAAHPPEKIRPLRLVSFEVDLDPLALAAKNAGYFPHLRHRAPHAILKEGRWQHPDNLLTWELLKGDFLSFLESAHVPDLIFYDPFSSKTDTALWTPEVFARLFKHCAGKSADLFTYSSATAVRVALLAGGFFVADGVGTGPRAATTAAFTRKDRPAELPSSPRLLGEEWLARWRRSVSKFPAALPESERPRFEQLIETHPQFAHRAF